MLDAAPLMPLFLSCYHAAFDDMLSAFTRGAPATAPYAMLFITLMPSDDSCFLLLP